MRLNSALLMRLGVNLPGGLPAGLPRGRPGCLKVASLGAGVLAVLCAALPAVAEEPVTTVLHLSSSWSMQVTPDELTAELVAQNTSPSPAEAQRHVNALMADGMKTASGVVGVEAQAIGYAVMPADDKRTNWTAQQTLTLKGSDGPAVLGLTNQLQAMGFVTASLDWRLSPALRRKAHDEATTDALKDLQHRAASVATTLGLHVDHLQEVRLDGPVGQPFAPMRMRAAVTSSPPPQASAAAEAVVAEVQADVVLRP
jgi:uncharacterized protein